MLFVLHNIFFRVKFHYVISRLYMETLKYFPSTIFIFLLQTFTKLIMTILKLTTWTCTIVMSKTMSLMSVICKKHHWQKQWSKHGMWFYFNESYKIFSQKTQFFNVNTVVSNHVNTDHVPPISCYDVWNVRQTTPGVYAITLTTSTYHSRRCSRL